MTVPDRAADELALRRLSALYAAGADRRGGDAYAGVRVTVRGALATA